MVKVKDTLTPAAIARAERHAALKARPCKHCGKPIGNIDKRQVKCGLKCPALNKIKTNCLICNKELLRYPKHLQKFKGACCSHACQKIWAGKCGKGVKADWESRSSKARKRWVALSSQTRKKSNKWFCAISSKLAVEKVQEKGWKYRLNLRLGSASGRKVKRRASDKASGSVHLALRKIESRRRYFELSPWEKKIGNKLSNGKHRRRRIHENKRAKLQGCKDIQEARRSWIQMRFDWMGD